MGLPVVPGLRFVRNILRRRMRGKQSGLRRLRPCNERRVISCSPASRRKMEPLNRRVLSLETILWKRMSNWR